MIEKFKIKYNSLQNTNYGLHNLIFPFFKRCLNMLYFSQTKLIVYFHFRDDIQNDKVNLITKSKS